MVKQLTSSRDNSGAVNCRPSPYMGIIDRVKFYRGAHMKTTFLEDLTKAVDGMAIKAPHVTPLGPLIELLVDGDLVAYRNAAATQGTFYEVGSLSTKYHKDAKKLVDKLTKEGEEPDYSVIKKKIEPEPVAHALGNLKRTMEESIEAVEDITGRPVVVRVYLTADVLFRDQVSPTYKKSREGVERPVHLLKCKQFLEEHYGAETVNGYEADDLIAIRHTEVGPGQSVVMSIDKDLKQLPGMHFDFTKKLMSEVSPEEARENFWTQVLVGDKVDDIQGLHGVGPVTAKKILKDCHGKSENKYYRTVLKAYKEHFPREEGESKSSWYTRIVMEIGKSCRLLYLSRKLGEVWDAPVAVSGDTK